MKKSLKISVEFSLLSALLFLSSGTVLAAGMNPVANPRAVVVDGNARFTVLTPQLVRMEWSQDGKFIDAASLVFINRRLPVPPFRVTTRDGWLNIKTSDLTLRYKKDSGEFASGNLEISLMVDGQRVVWHPGDKDTTNLLGTIRTLDGANGPRKLNPGLLSKDGWTLVDDSHRPLFNDAKWKWAVPRPVDEKQDWYFFGYGRNYVKELGDYVKIAGRIPMPPRFAFGAWWSRYWSYTDQELKDLVGQFEDHTVPLAVLVVDMDWHNTFGNHIPLPRSEWKLDQLGRRAGWTGYTWDKNLFPDPKEFLAWCHEKGLKVTLNLHPADGIQPWEDCYPAMARAMGIDPATRRYVPFVPTDEKFAENYFKLVLEPLQKEGVNFWWIDWQQWDTTRIKYLKPTWWINYLFYTDMEREGSARPIILSRWGGLGAHRYQIGFSGDVITSWASLKFQPYFTSTAANVGFGYWSHDIGGHIPGIVSPELYTRWVQWGALSPILRTHTTRNGNAERRIWAYPYPYAHAMRNAFLLRYRLLPYIYTSSRDTYDSGVSMLHPLYYNYPDSDDAYRFPDEYFYGKNLIVAPVVDSMSAGSELASEDIWVPPGTWIGWYSGKRFEGPRVVKSYFSLDQIPILVRAGSVIPMQTGTQKANITNVDPLVLRVFPARVGSGSVYEDEGNTDGYTRGRFSRTNVTFESVNDKEMRIVVEPATGSYPGMKKSRSYIFQIMNVFPPRLVVCDGKTVKIGKEGWTYDGNKLETVIRIPAVAVSRRLVLTVEFAGDINSSLLDGTRGLIKRVTETTGMLLKNIGWAPDIMFHEEQTGDRMSLFPARVGNELSTFRADLPNFRSAVEFAAGKNDSLKELLINHLADAPSTAENR